MNNKYYFICTDCNEFICLGDIEMAKKYYAAIFRIHSDCKFCITDSIPFLSRDEYDTIEIMTWEDTNDCELQNYIQCKELDCDKYKSLHIPPEFEDFYNTYKR